MVYKLSPLLLLIIFSAMCSQVRSFPDKYDYKKDVDLILIAEVTIRNDTQVVETFKNNVRRPIVFKQFFRFEILDSLKGFFPDKYFDKYYYMPTPNVYDSNGNIFATKSMAMPRNNILPGLFIGEQCILLFKFEKNKPVFLGIDNISKKEEIKGLLKAK